MTTWWRSTCSVPGRPCWSDSGSKSGPTRLSRSRSPSENSCRPRPRRVRGVRDRDALGLESFDSLNPVCMDRDVGKTIRGVMKDLGFAPSDGHHVRPPPPAAPGLGRCVPRPGRRQGSARRKLFYYALVLYAGKYGIESRPQADHHDAPHVRLGWVHI
jgi:hypothetical protein